MMPPYPDRNKSPLMPFERNLPESINIAQYRSEQDIFWSCLVTIFACTWVAVHPNLPGPNVSGWTKFKRWAVVMFYALLAPEFMAAWALRQWMAARSIASQFNKMREGDGVGTEVDKQIPWYFIVPIAFKECWMASWDGVKEWFRGSDENAPKNWTIVEGFLVQMGGLVLYEDEAPSCVLTFEDLKQLIKKGSVDPPRIVKDKISYISKGDIFMVLFVVFQTTWFVLQCLARWGSNLPVTQLEVVTLAFVVPNVITSGLWWMKPRNVPTVIRVQLKPGCDGRVNRSRSKTGTKNGSEGKGLLDNGEGKEAWIARKLSKAMNDGWAGWLFAVPYRLVQATLRPIKKMWSQGNTHIGPQLLRMPIFYAGEPDAQRDFLFLVIGVLFGCIHLIPWSAVFPSTGERSLWRISTLVIIIEPVAYYLYTMADNLEDCQKDTLSMSLLIILGILSALGVLLYIFSRFLLFILAIITLRGIPPDAYTSVEWTTFIPHV